MISYDAFDISLQVNKKLDEPEASEPTKATSVEGIGNKTLSTSAFGTLRPRQNGHHIADSIIKSLSLIENCYIVIQIKVWKYEYTFNLKHNRLLIIHTCKYIIHMQSILVIS